MSMKCSRQTNRQYSQQGLLVGNSLALAPPPLRPQRNMQTWTFVCGLWHLPASAVALRTRLSPNSAPLITP